MISLEQELAQEFEEKRDYLRRVYQAQRQGEPPRYEVIRLLLNNFITKFPKGGWWQDKELGDNLDTKIKDLRFANTDGSNLFRGKTVRAFCSDVAKAAVAEGIPKEIVYARMDSREMEPVYMEQLYGAYKRLRKKGYERGELIR